MGQNHIFLKMTYRQMVKNKVRTLVTIIGIMLSAALITAIKVCWIIKSKNRVTGTV